METLQRTANRGSISTGFDIANSLKFEADNSEYLKANNTFASTTPTSRKKGTVSFWIKRTEIGNGVSGKQMYIFASSDSSRYSNLGFDEFDNLTVFSGDSSWNSVSPYTYNKFRDTSAWYHIVIRYDTTDSTASNRLRVYSNGTEVSWVTAPNITQDGVMTYSGMNGPCWHSWGTIYSYFTPAKFFSGYLAEAYFVDGQSLAPTEFGEYDSTSGIWKPKAYDGTYGNCGYYLDFADSGNLGDDESGNGFDFDLNNITAADQATDTPTNNFCTLNPLFTGFNSSVQLPSNGATQYGLSGGNQDLSYAGTMGVTKGKWYFENYINEVGSTYGARIYVGFHTFQQDYDGVQVGASTNGDALAVWQMDAGNYVAWNGGSRSITSGLGTVGSGGVGKVVGIALNLDDNQISFYYDGSAVTNGTNLSLYNMGSQTDDGIFAIPVVQTKGSVQTANFGGYIPSNFISSAASDANGYGTFEYAPPSGYYALCTKNLAEYG